MNICFESSVPHFVRNQVLSLKEQGRNPAFLINMSNDGWFRFSQQIDQHLATHVFRAVENRRAYVAATNGGFSAIIDAQGRIRSIGERRAAQAVVGEVSLEQRNAPIYHRIGDAIPQICTVFLFACLGLGFLRKEEQRTPQSELIADVER